MPPELLANVALRAHITDPIFTYRVPPRLHALARLGQLVWAPLRRQQVQGIIVELYRPMHDDVPGLSSIQPAPGAPGEFDQITLRDLADVADPEATLTPAQIQLARWISDYYRTPLYDALALMLPPGVGQESEPVWQATTAGLAAELGALPERERAVLYFLRQRGPTSERELRKALRGSDTDLRQTYAALQERGLAARGTLLSRARARPRIEHLARLLVPAERIPSVLESLAQAPKQQAVISFLHQHSNQTLWSNGDTIQAVPLSTIYSETNTNRAVLRGLEKKQLIEVLSREVRRDPLAGDLVPPDTPPTLTRAQERVWQPIAQALDAQADPLPIRPTLQGQGRLFLLHGVTGSGKTEIYLRAIGRAMRQGRQALVLVPEIALTAQLVRRFAARFPGRLAVLHSGLSLGERYDEWRRLRNGEARLAIGSRSAVFAPMPNLGLIIVDEEHEASYKHDGPPRYHARDTAMRLANLTSSVLILGSATPSVESYARAKANKITLLELHERVGMSVGPNNLPQSVELPLPPIKVVDMRHELQHGNRSIFSRPLQSALSQALERGEQAILFLNRRGAAAFIMCRDCGHVVACPNCSTPLVVHYDDDHSAMGSAEGRRFSLLVCHSCNHHGMLPTHCPECWSPRIKSFGIGTQRVVEEVQALFPEARTLRWDRDSVTRKGDHGRLLDLFLQHKADVLVGTQMIAKGLDLPLVSVVGVVAADTGLHLPDFRAGERTFQLLTQVAGRAGRRSTGAQVVIQTYTPDHYALRAAQEHDYKAFYIQEIAFRRQAGYPPYSRLLRFIYSAGSDERGRRVAEELSAMLHQLASNLDLGDWSIIGPAPAFFHRQRNRYRWHLMLRAERTAPLLEALHLPPGWVLDVDPVHVL